MSVDAITSKEEFDRRRMAAKAELDRRFPEWSNSVKWFMAGAPQYVPHYLDVLHAGSLAAVIAPELAPYPNALLALPPASGHYGDVLSLTVEHEGRQVHVAIASLHRMFVVSLKDQERHVGDLNAPEPSDVAAAMGAFLGERASADELAERFPRFLKEPDPAVRRESAGVIVADRWAHILHWLEGWSPYTYPLALRLSRTLPFAGLYAVKSHFSLSLSRCTRYPFARATPYFVAYRPNRFRVTRDQDEVPVEVGEEAAFAMVQAATPADIGPAIQGTADDLAARG